VHLLGRLTGEHVLFMELSITERSEGDTLPPGVHRLLAVIPVHGAGRVMHGNGGVDRRLLGREDSYC